MNRIAITLTLLAIATAANAGTDYQCVNDCTRKGYMYQYCQSLCSYDDNPSRQQPVQPQNPYQTPQLPRAPQTDYQCVNDCTNKGYLYQYCQQRCSY